MGVMERSDGLEAIHKPLPPPVIARGRTALLIIDMQYLDAHPDYGDGRAAKEKGVDHLLKPYHDRLATVVIPTIQSLQAAARAARVEVIHVKIAALTPDGRDATPRYRVFEYAAPPDSKEAEILEEVAPRPGEIVLPKTSTSAFTTTVIDQVLRNLGITTLIVCGVRTQSCVETTVRDAADRGYDVILVPEGCAAIRQEFHERALDVLAGIFCHVWEAGRVLEALAALR